MVCQRCKHDNPASARFCNNCGARQEEAGAEETSISGPMPLRIPSEVRGTGVRLRRSLFDGPNEAAAAMVAAGFEVQPELTRTMSFEGVGTVVRIYGVLGNAFGDEDEVTDTSNPMEMLRFDPKVLLRLGKIHQNILNAVERRMHQPDNDRVREKLESGRLKYVPCNGRLVQSLEVEIARCGLHLPWSVHGFDADLARNCARVLKPYGFVCYYSKLGLVHSKGGEPCFISARQASNPFGVDVLHSWVPPIHDDVLDEDVGLLVEAIARA